MSRTIKDEILGFFREDDTNSMTRLLLFIMVTAVFAAWLTLSLRSGSLLDLPGHVVDALAGGGILKFAQKIPEAFTTKNENKNN